MKQKHIVCISDLQIPLHDEPKVMKLWRYIWQTQPDEVILIGDEIDMTSLGRWVKSKSEEYTLNLQFELDEFYRLFSLLRKGKSRLKGYKGPISVVESNHLDRARSYLEQYAPALLSLRSLELGNLMRYPELGITDQGLFYDFHPGWTATHGHVGGALSQVPGKTAENISKTTTQKSTLIGHTHRLAAIPATFGYSGNTFTRWYVEAGNLMDMSQALYLKKGCANWQSGFAELFIAGDHVEPRIRTIESI